MQFLERLSTRCVLPYLEQYSNVAAVAWDEAGRIVYGNQTFFALLAAESPPLGKEIADYLILPDPVTAVPIGGGEPYRRPARLKTETVDYRCEAVIFSFERGWIAFCEKPILLQNNMLNGMAELNRELASLTWDLNQKNRAIEIANQLMAQEKEELKKSELRYRQLIEDTQVIITIFDQSGQVNYINEYGLGLFQYERDGLVGRSLFDTVLPNYSSAGTDLWKLFQENLSTLDSFKRFTGENQARSGKRLWIDWTVRHLTDAPPGSKEFMAIGVDVTAQRRIRAEEERGYNRRRRANLLNDAIEKQLSTEAMVSVARQIGLETAEIYVCVLFPANEALLPAALTDDPLEQQHRLDLLIDCLGQEEGRVAWQAPEGLVLLQPLAAAKKSDRRNLAVSLAAKAADCLHRCGSVNQSIPCGLAHSLSSTTTLAELYGQALLALRYGPALLGPRESYHWQEFGKYQFVVRDIHSTAATQFVESQLGPLLSLRRPEKRAEWLQTLTELITNDSVEQIGKRLNIVSKTVRYRKRILEQILGVSLDSFETLADLSLALKILTVNRD